MNEAEEEAFALPHSLPLLLSAGMWSRLMPQLRRGRPSLRHASASRTSRRGWCWRSRYRRDR